MATLLKTGQNYYNWQLTYALHLYRSVSHQRLHMLPDDGVNYILKQETNFGRAVKWIVEKAIEDGDFPPPEAEK